MLCVDNRFVSLNSLRRNSAVFWPGMGERRMLNFCASLRFGVEILTCSDVEDDKNDCISESEMKNEAWFEKN